MKASPSLRHKTGVKSLLLLLLFPLSLSAQQSYTFENPVLRGVADAGCIRYAGRYYLGGVATNGDFFVSDDLLHWNQRIHVFDLDNEWTHGSDAKNNQVHADDIIYSGGLFHLLFSVNFWGSDRHIVHITHATSPSIEGPFQEVREDQWYENRIDPHVFQDEDGRLYLYMVKFTDGNTIWGRELNQDFSFASDAVQQFSSQPGTWETLDNRVAEGPFVIKYRGKYYMMYNANHTAPEFGNYHLGVCEAPSPLAFNPGGKYPQPVVGPNTESIQEQYTDLLRYGGKGFNPIDLKQEENHFPLDTVPEGPFRLLLGHHNGSQVSINGHQINKGDRFEYAFYQVEPTLLKQGDNIITLSKPVSHLYLFDLSPVKTKEVPSVRDSLPGTVLVTPGQPNIVRGLNGWEWWLVYMANEGWARHQFVDRIHFVNNRLTVDGITGNGTPGFHPAPAKPQYAGTSIDSIPKGDKAFLLEITCKSKGIPQEWRIERNHDLLTVWKDKVLTIHHLPATEAEVAHLINEAQGDEIIYVSYCQGYDEYGPYFSGWQAFETKGQQTILPASSECYKDTIQGDYSFSVQFSNPTPQEGQYAVSAWQDNKNNVQFIVDAARQELLIRQKQKGKSSDVAIPLSETRIHYPDIKYTDTYEKQYRFDCETYVDAVEYPHLNATNDSYAASLSIEQQHNLSYYEDMAGRMTLEYLDTETDKWHPIAYRQVPSSNRAWQRVTFPQVKTRALRMINKHPNLYSSRNIYQVKTSRAFSQDCQLRVEKRGMKLYVYYDQRLMQTITLLRDKPTSLGLSNQGKTPVVIGNILCYTVK
ncbi:MAG: family 43 glycosylhydrolase [Bacteroidaceae bacterium]|nr:family 43 glycosylhydrolase [Bacteroidaceae bacterium]